MKHKNINFLGKNSAKMLYEHIPLILSKEATE